MSVSLLEETGSETDEVATVVGGDGGGEAGLKSQPAPATTIKLAR
jgi:hypothetical protein